MADFEQAKSNPELGTEVQGKLDDLTTDEARSLKFPNADDQAKEALTNNKTVTETFGINRDNFPGEHMNAIKNVFQNICGKNIDEIEMTDIFKLSDMKKSELAREVVAAKIPDFSLSLPSKDESNPNIMINAKYFYDFFHNGTILTEENFKKYIESKKSELKSTLYNANDRQDADNTAKNMENININKIKLDNILGQMQHNIEKKSKQEYKKMFKGDVPPMYRVYTHAVGDLTGTKGIGQGRNTGREYFKYNLNEKNQISSSLRFGSKEGPAEIGISAYGIDGTTGGGSVHILLGNNQKIQLDYTNNGLNVVGKLPEGVQWKNGVLIIPNKPIYKDNPMEIKTESKQYDKGGYDDVLFNFVCNNIGIGIATPTYDNKISKNFGLGEHKTDNNEKNRIFGCISDITNDISRCFAKDIPINIGVSVDKTEFDKSRISDFMKATKDIGLDSVMYNVTDLNDKAKTKIIEKLTQAFHNFSRQIESSNFEWDENGKEAEKRLAKCRFWEVMDIALKDKNFRSQLASGKIQINPEFTIGEKGNRNISVSYNEQDMVLHIQNK